MPGGLDHKAKDFLAAVLDAVGALVVVLDRDGCILYWNRACRETTGYSAEEVMGIPFWDRLLAPEEIEPVKLVFENLRAGLFPNTHENHWVAKDGSRRMIAWSNTALVGEDERVEYVIGTGLDITRERELARRVRINDHLASLATLVAGITHEINNPLNAAHLHLTLLKRRLARMKTGEAEPALAEAEAAGREIERVAALAREFLEFSRPPAQKRSRADLNAIAQETVRLCEPEADSAGVALHFRGGAGIFPQVDGRRIKQVILNLTRNAVDAAGPGGNVRVAVSSRGRDAMIEVEDDGPGLPAPYETIVEPFYTTKKHGTGLGLAVSHRIVADHDGTIQVDSRPGRTLFTIVIPTGRAAVAGSPTPSPSGRDRGPRR